MKTYTSKILERKRKSRKIKSVSREDALQKTNDLKIALKLLQKKLKSVYYTRECQFCGQNFKVLVHKEKFLGLDGKSKRQGKSYCNHSCANGAYRRKIWQRENENLNLIEILMREQQ